MKKIATTVLALALIACCIFTFAACKDDNPGGNDSPNKTIRLSTTTSVNDSGLMEYLIPYFEADTGYKLEIASAGTGAAINAAKFGNADVILVHSISQENAFVAAGYARAAKGQSTERVSFMYNYFALVGPSGDPAGAGEAETVKNAFAAIAGAEAKFISRGDQSGTHTKEISLWDTALGITANVESLPKFNWYESAGRPMGACLTMANEQNAYVLTDKATFLSYKNNPEGDKLPKLNLLYEEDDSLKNTYSMIAVSPDAPFTNASGNALPAGTVTVNTDGADIFINWMLSEHAKALIAFYGSTNYGEPLFTLIK